MEPTPSFFDSIAGKRIAGRYLVDRLLGSGGMGLVAAARYPELGQKVAIKFLRPELAADGAISARFMREARVAAKVKSAHFVRVFDVGRLESGVPYMVMEMLTGRDLGDEMSERAPLPITDVLDYFLQALAGVAEIHALGIVHRDLKPSNLFIATAAGTTIVKVLDFGISKETKSESVVPLTATDHLLGTPQYMSPEQIKASRDVDARSDVWSLGVILYELLTQALPFPSEGGGVGEMFGKILYVDPEPPSALRADLPDGLEAVVLKCIRRPAEERYANVLELAEALRPFMTPGSLHRIDAVKQAASAPPAEIDEDPVAEIGDEANIASRASTQESSPDAKRQQLVLAPTTPLARSGEQTTGPTSSRGGSVKLADARPGDVARPPEAPGGGAAPVTAMTSSSLVSSKPKSRAATRGTLVALAALGVVAIGGVAAMSIARGSGRAGNVASTSASAQGAPRMASAVTAASVTASTGPASLSAPNASTTSAAGGASAGATSLASASATKPRVAPKARATARPRVASSAAPQASAPVLIFDRK